MTIRSRILAFLLCGVVALVTAGCSKEEDKAGDGAMRDAPGKMEEHAPEGCGCGCGDLEDAAKKAGEALEEGAEEAGEALEEGAEKAGSELEKATGK